MDPKLTGEIDGLRVKVQVWDEPRGKSSRRVTLLSANLPGLLPAGLRLQVEGMGWKLLQGLGLADLETGDEWIDRSLRITAEDSPAALAMMRDSAVRTALRSILGDRLRVTLEGRALRVLRVGVADREIGQRYDQLLALARAMDAALVLPWHRLANSRGLALRVDGRRLRIEGDWDDLALVATAGRGRDGAVSRTEIRVRVPAPLPRGLWITRRDEEAPPGCLDLPDPVIGHLLCVRCARVEAAAELLDDDELRGLLLEVVHGHPGSTVQGDTVILRLGVFVTREIEDRIGLVCHLARSLAQRAG